MAINHHQLQIYSAVSYPGLLALVRGHVLKHELWFLQISLKDKKYIVQSGVIYSRYVSRFLSDHNTK